MENLWRIYHQDVPLFLRLFAAQPPMQRLKQIGMNCGCEYTSYSRFANLSPCSRYDHSMGTALIVWHFSQDKRQAAAGLFHDIATPAFSHVIDFLNGDHLRQESTEEGTQARIESMQPVLEQEGLLVQEVADYHRYPLADNDAPRLSADRLEYTMSNLYHYGMMDKAELSELYQQLQAGTDEQGKGELIFRQAEPALRFAKAALKCSKIYVSPEDRYAMQRLSELLGEAIRRHVLQREQLYTTEPKVISLLQSDPVCRKRWEAYCSCRKLICVTEKPSDDGWLQVAAKKRYINPMVQGQGRVSTLFPDFSTDLLSFRQESQAQWMREEPDNPRR